MGCGFVGITFSFETFFFFFIVLQLSNNFSLSSFYASFASFVGLQPQCTTFVWLVADFCRPIFLFSRLIGLHIWMCCDSVSFDFIKPATTVARFIQHSCLFIYFKSVPYRKVRNLKCKQSSRSVGPCFEHMRWYKLYLNDNSSSTYIKHIQLTLGEELTSNLYNLTSNSLHYSCPRSVYCRSIVFLLVM